MLKKLKKLEMKLYWIDKNGYRHEGCPSWLRGDVTELSGDVSGISGNVLWLSGDVTGLRGDVSWLRGNVNDCNITEEERKKGVNVEDLIGENK